MGAKTPNLRTVALVLSALLISTAAEARPMTDAQIKQAIIKQSIASYPGSCPCPEFTDRGGRRCGARSAWSRAGGYAPKCYPSDVSRSEVEAYRANNSAARAP